MTPLAIFVDGNLVLNLPSASDFEEVDSQLLIWVSGKLILQAQEGSGPVSFNGVAVVEVGTVFSNLYLKFTGVAT